MPCLKRYLKEKVSPNAELKINKHNFFVVDLHDGQDKPLLPCETTVNFPLYTEDNQMKDEEMITKMFKDLLQDKDKKLSAEEQKIFEHQRQLHFDDMMLADQKEDPKREDIKTSQKEVTPELPKNDKKKSEDIVDVPNKRERKKNEKYNDYLDDKNSVNPTQSQGRGRPSKKKKDEDTVEQKEDDKKVADKEKHIDKESIEKEKNGIIQKDKKRDNKEIKQKPIIEKTKESKKDTKPKQKKEIKSPGVKTAEWQETHAACCSINTDVESPHAVFGCEQCERWQHLDCLDFNCSKELSERIEIGNSADVKRAKDLLQQMYDMINNEWDAW